MRSLGSEGKDPGFLGFLPSGGRGVKAAPRCSAAGRGWVCGWRVGFKVSNIPCYLLVSCSLFCFFCLIFGSYGSLVVAHIRLDGKLMKTIAMEKSRILS